MRIKLFLIAAAAVAISSCTSDCTENEMELSSTSRRIEATNDMLEFSSEDEFNAAVLSVSPSNNWQNNGTAVFNRSGFFSLADLYEQAMSEAESLDDTQQSYEHFKAKYAAYLYFPEYEEDYGVYLPVSNRNVAKLLNPDGEVRIAGEVRNFKDISDYRQLQEAGVAMYDLTTRAYNIGTEYDSGWTSYDGRKIRLKCGYQVVDVDPAGIGNAVTFRLHFEISFRKKTWLGWMNYSSSVSMNGFYQFTSGTATYISESKTADSSHDYYYGPFYAPYTWVSTQNGMVIGAPISPVHVEVELGYRGIPDEYMPDYNFTLPGILL